MTDKTPAMPELPDGATVLPDGSAFAIASFPLPANHWLYAPREYRDGEENPIELPSPILSHQAHGDVVRAAIRYAVRGATMCGKEPDFDPDALVQNAMYALCGPFGGAALQSAQPAAPQYNGWYCAHCQRGVDASEVTFHEQHTVCGRVITNDAPPALQPAAAVSDEELQAIDDAHNWQTTAGRHAAYRAILALRPAQQSAQQAVPMTPEQMHDAYKQSPDSKNCMQCAAAYMLGLPMSAVPDFEKAGADAWESFEAFFADRGFTAEMFPPSVEIVGDYLASGDTERGTSHMVVMRGGELLHDPHPSNAGLKSIQAVWLITRRAGCRDGITKRADGGEV